MRDQFDLDRFVTAQNAGGSYEIAVSELRRGRKIRHWMWFVFPQFAGLGQSAMSKMYSIRTIDEAKAYLHHRVLGQRLLEVAGIVGATTNRTAEEIFGSTDAQKLQSSMTLFLRAAPVEPVFSQVLGLFFDGMPDQRTDELIARS